MSGSLFYSLGSALTLAVATMLTYDRRSPPWPAAEECPVEAAMAGAVVEPREPDARARGRCDAELEDGAASGAAASGRASSAAAAPAGLEGPDSLGPGLQ